MTLKTCLSRLAMATALLTMAIPTIAPAQDDAAVAPAPPAAATRYVIHAGHLIATPGQPTLANKSIIVENGKVVAIRDGFVEGGTVIDLSQSYVLPGLINLHTHLALPSYERAATWRFERTDRLVLEALPRLKTMVEAGFTTVRDLGDDSSIMYLLADAVKRGTIVGPRILASEQAMGIGNAYFTTYAMGFKPELAPYFVSRGQCITRDACRDAVRDEVKRGAQVIKIRTSILPITDGRLESVETVDELKWIIDMAHQLKRTVAVHTVVGPSFQPVTNAILAGADTIEHGPLSDVQVKLMKERGTAYVPTLAVAKSSAATYPGLYDRIRAGALLAAKAGLRMGFGTDFPLVPVDQSAREFVELQSIGLSPSEALMTATVNAARMVDRADQIGAIAPGMIADIIAVDADPLQDLTVLGKVRFVMKDGGIVKAAR
jgi:imidazolonepropionase-like amidohydrolase